MKRATVNRARPNDSVKPMPPGGPGDGPPLPEVPVTPSVSLATLLGSFMAG